MNKSFSNNNIETKVMPSIALSNTAIGYGKAIGVETETTREKALKESPAGLLRFYYGEFVTGILFIFALSLYTLLMPDGIANPVRYVVGMIDKILKKALDIVGSILGLLLALPIFIAVPIIIKLTSSGPVFYTQQRIGIDRRRRQRRIHAGSVHENQRIRDRRRQDYLGRPFKVIKFRTMIHNAEARTGAVWATRNDSRVTPIGRLLRKTRIDEVPQLINVLMGDMSLVGPRPERPVFVKDLSQKIPHYKARLKVKPGITGLAQVSTGYDSSLETVADKISFDIKYIRNWSIFSDMKILLKTVVVVLTGRGAC